MGLNTYIYITTDFIALHAWPECPYEQVSFLKYPHRHKFFVKVIFQVDHDHRQIEFFMAKKELDEYIDRKYKNKDLGPMSCEMIAKDILRVMNAIFKSVVSVSVSEDEENGAIVEVSNDPSDL